MRNAWIEVNLSHLSFNLDSLIKAAGNAEIIGIVKADAYGHGAEQVSKRLVNEGVKLLAVADLHEALSLREAGVTQPILTLSAPPKGFEAVLIEHSLMPLISNLNDAVGISEIAERYKRSVPILLAADSGMGREGFLCNDENITTFKKIYQLPNIEVKWLLSHFAAAEWDDQSYSKAQFDQFNAFTAKLSAVGLNIPPRTMANSAAMLRMPECHFDAVRPGIALYGQYPFPQASSMLTLKPVMSVKARISLVKKVETGFSISYGATFTTERESLIGVLPLGYADGMPLSLTNNGHVIVRGGFAPIVGRVCMDAFMVDLTDIPGVAELDEAIVLGSDGIKEITVDDISKAANSSSYEVLCRFGQRLPKKYIVSCQ